MDGTALWSIGVLSAIVKDDMKMEIKAQVFHLNLFTFS